MATPADYLYYKWINFLRLDMIFSLSYPSSLLILLLNPKVEPERRSCRRTTARNIPTLEDVEIGTHLSEKEWIGNLGRGQDVLLAVFAINDAISERLHA
ncbi:hypothetical protein LIPSTDRAFT_5123 [Lipomyces starkeyi NRRL Y-11557]|uniref:Uncharacterized protein n=1 Tax=Lipomyces starkeyi NRRL Y-11557 TaxID=675824 RepID=A0A1E3Q086_LIPST|nr:hypothetical protein LIPSTDRAFT_5123 [Lipomyces starkeyi NRRL Y-11557]